MAMPFPSGVKDLSRLVALRRTPLLDTDCEEAFDRLTRLATRCLNVPVSLISLVDEDRQWFKSQVGLPLPWAELRQTPLSHSFCRLVAETGDPLMVEDARVDPRVADNLAVRDLGVIAYLGLPMTTSDGHCLGSFCVIDTQPRQWKPEEIDLLRDLREMAMDLIELRGLRTTRNQEDSKDRSLFEVLHARATRDGLTGLFNRAHLDENLEQAVQHALATGRPLSLILVDVDHFKQVNDTWGHLAGDRCLQQVARVLQTLFRYTDQVFRYGGEEFVVLLPGADASTAQERADHCRTVLAELVRVGEGASMRPVTLSAGVAAVPWHGNSAVSLLASADAALYQAKNGGRNQVVVAHRDPPPEIAVSVCCAEPAEIPAEHSAPT